jgi:UPF0755 protein
MINRSRSTSLFFIVVLIGICAALLISAYLLTSIPQRAADTFGPASPSLGTLTQFYLSLRLIYQEQDLTRPANPQGEEVPFQVESGESPYSVANNLQKLGLIPNARAFRDYLIYSGLDTRVQAGDYILSPALSPLEIAHKLMDASPSEVIFTILAGWRLEEIAASLPTTGLTIRAEEFFDSAERKGGEGFMFPGSYVVQRQITADDLTNSIANRMEQDVSAEIWAGSQGQGLTRYEAIILASIVERETIVDDEMPLIASVFLNRLAIGMKLDADPTVQYALGYNVVQDTWWTNPLSTSDLQVDSPFNTYLYSGLPPTPICNPGIDALRAVAFPAVTPYYYFRASCDGSGRHTFAETFDEHVNNACR